MEVRVKISVQGTLARVKLASLAHVATLPQKVARKTHVKMVPLASKVKDPMYVSVKLGSQAGTVTKRSTSASLTHAKTVSVALK
jgi:hypothetical protein